MARLDHGLRWHLRLARARRWEFWPAWLFYLPIIVWIVLLGLRHRHLTLFTAANPGMDEGGVVGERKSPLLLGLRAAQPEATPQLLFVPASWSLAEKRTRILAFANGRYPLVLKPDIGQRGRGVSIVRHPGQVERYLEGADFDVLAQEFVAGPEFGVFVYRHPATDRLALLSITHKRLPTVIGDGRHCLGELILADSRARLSAEQLFARHRDRLADVPAAGTRFPLVELGSHCRGAVFESAMARESPALRARLREIIGALPDFHFGRLDIIAPDDAALAAGRGLQVLEVNGVTSEAAHVYHPGTPLLTGYQVFFRQWALAFAIGARNYRAGAATVSPWRLLRLFLQDLRRHDAAERCVRNASAAEAEGNNSGGRP